MARSGRYILGPEVEAFERELADYLGVAHVVGVANGGAVVMAVTTSAAPAVPPPAAAPPHTGYDRGFWGVAMLIATESVIFLGLVSSYFFTWASSPTWPGFRAMSPFHESPLKSVLMAASPTS